MKKTDRNTWNRIVQTVANLVLKLANCSSFHSRNRTVSDMMRLVLLSGRVSSERMRTTCVGPNFRKCYLFFRSLLKKKPSGLVEQENRKCAMELSPWSLRAKYMTFKFIVVANNIILKVNKNTLVLLHEVQLKQHENKERMESRTNK